MTGAAASPRGKHAVATLVTLALWPLAVALLAPPAWGDGGTLRVMEPSGAFVVAVFSTPEPLHVAPADLSVLVLERTGGHPVLDAAVSLEVRPPAGSDGAPQRLTASRQEATNKLLYAAPFVPGTPGDWTLHVTVTRGSESADVGCILPVTSDRAGLTAIWPYLAIPPIAIALYALRAWLMARRGQQSQASERPASARSAAGISIRSNRDV
jgi:hypothetical protein